MTISGLTLNGNKFSGNGVSMGGAILNQGGHLTVADAFLPRWSLFGSSPGGSAKGGAIASTGDGASLTVLNDIFFGDRSGAPTATPRTPTAATASGAPSSPTSTRP